MDSRIFYEVTGTLIRNVEQKSKPILIHEIFNDSNPILAREKAFNLYQNYIDVLSESRGFESNDFGLYSKLLKSFVDSNTLLKTDEIDYDFDKGIYIYLVLNDESFTTKEGNTVYKNKILIHCFDNCRNDFSSEILNSLITEYSIYKKMNYDCKNYVKQLPLLKKGNVKPTILVTPKFNQKNGKVTF